MVNSTGIRSWNVSREFAVVPVDVSFANAYLVALWIACKECQRWWTGVAKGAACTGLNIEDLRNLPFKLTLFRAQAEIVRRVETLFAFAARLEARLAQTQTAATRLSPPLLAKAFCGELAKIRTTSPPTSCCAACRSSASLSLSPKLSEGARPRY